MVKFRKKPIVIDAVQFTEEVARRILLDGAPPPEGTSLASANYHAERREVTRCSLSIDTLEGRMTVQYGDWIIKGVNGEFYPCKPDIFDKTYEPA